MKNYLLPIPPKHMGLLITSEYAIKIFKIYFAYFSAYADHLDDTPTRVFGTFQPREAALRRAHPKRVIRAVFIICNNISKRGRPLEFTVLCG